MTDAPLLKSAFVRLCHVWCHVHVYADNEGPEESFEQMAGAVCKEVYGESLRGLIVACRRYKGELLEACLELLLSAPTLLIPTHVSLLAPPWKQANAYTPALLAHFGRLVQHTCSLRAPTM